MHNARGNDQPSQNARARRTEHGIRARVDQARGAVENVREKAEVAFREKPYLLPVAAGAVGFGVGVLLGSRIARFILFTAIGTIVSEALSGEVRRIARDFVDEGSS